jgi:aminopeptidase-like protein
LISCHVCHPSLANDNLSGTALAVKLAEVLAGASLRYSYRFLFIPGTIGSITWLARNSERARQIRHGLVVTCVGDSGCLHYKRSRQGNAEIDRAVIKALRDRRQELQVRDFSPYGYDERQYCSPGFNLPVGSLTRSPHGSFPQYHTSADNLDFVRPEALADSFAAYLSVIGILEGNARYQNLNPCCEPQLGKRGLYRSIGGLPDAGQLESALLWVLNLSDSTHSLLEIAERADLPFELIHQAAETLASHNLLEERTS